jgi:hypothetical protein
MKLTFFNWSAASLLLCSLLVSPALPQHTNWRLAPQSRPGEIPFSAVVETIEFKDVSQETQKLVLDRIGVRQGDMLTVEVRHRIGRELGRIQKGLTFTYKSGAKPLTARLIISADC